MNSMKHKSAMLMTKGIMDLKTDPPRLVCNVLTYRHPESGKEVTLHPVPNIASPSFFGRMLDGESLVNNYDKILCEDGRLPFRAGSAEANKQLMMKRLFPFFSLRPVISDGEKFDGIIQRDAIESRMAYQMVLDGMNPPVDPRARRGVERILDSYENGTRVVVPWGVYHMPYFRHRLVKEGFVETKSEEIVVLSFQQVLGMCLAGFLFSFLSMVFLFSLFFR